MQNLTTYQYVELFHLLFLDQLGRKMDKKLYILKGGCNLRFFFNSIRYSEDIDLDIQIIAKDTLRKKVTDILESSTFQHILYTKKIEISEFSDPKQTNTTQRWKVAIKIPAKGLPIPTKIEFSRRGVNEGILFESISSQILSEYFLPTLLLNHYSSATVCEQKILALIGRNETQARDIFDLYHLISSHGKFSIKNKSLIKQIGVAQDNAMSLTFNDFKGQVLSYLSVDYQAQYDTKAAWDLMVTSVVDFLEQLKHETD